MDKKLLVSLQETPKRSMKKVVGRGLKRKKQFEPYETIRNILKFP